MINLSFFPSRRLAFYMVRLFLTRSLAVLVALVLVLMTLDLLGESGKILAVPGNGDAELWRYVGLRIPLLVSRFLPFSVLLGTLIAFVGLNQNSEVVAMKAAGLSAHQILAPLIVASIGIAGALFAFNEGVVVNSRARGQRLVRQRLQADPARPAGSSATSGCLNGDDLIRAGIVSGRGPQLIAQRVTHLRPLRRRPAARDPAPTARSRARRRRLAARGRPDLRRQHERRPPACRE